MKLFNLWCVLGTSLWPALCTIRVKLSLANVAQIGMQVGSVQICQTFYCSRTARRMNNNGQRGHHHRAKSVLEVPRKRELNIHIYIYIFLSLSLSLCLSLSLSLSTHTTRTLLPPHPNDVVDFLPTCNTTPRAFINVPPFTYIYTHGYIDMYYLAG